MSDIGPTSAPTLIVKVSRAANGYYIVELPFGPVYAFKDHDAMVQFVLNKLENA